MPRPRRRNATAALEKVLPLQTSIPPIASLTSVITAGDGMQRNGQVLSDRILTPAIELLATNWLNYLSMPRGIEKYYQNLKTPIVAAPVSARILLGLSFIDDYRNDTYPDIQEEVRRNLANLKRPFVSLRNNPMTPNTVGGMIGAAGNMGGGVGAAAQKAIGYRQTRFWDKVAELLKFVYFGFSVAEIAYSSGERGRAELSTIQLIDPRKMRFMGTQGAISGIEYTSTIGTIPIPYENTLHLINEAYLTLGNDPYGAAPAEGIDPYVDAYRIALAAYTIASQRQATPLLVGKTDTNSDVPKLDAEGRQVTGADGLPERVNQGQVMRDSLQRAENSSVIVIDRMDEIAAIAQQGNAEFFNTYLKYLERMVALRLLVPETIMSGNLSGTGDSGLNGGHMEMLRKSTIATMQMVAEALIDDLIAPMLRFNYRFNYGQIQDYGYFPINSGESEDQVNLMRAIADVITVGAFAPTDEKVLARLNELAGIG